MGKTPENNYEANGFDPLTDEQREILKSRIKKDSKDPVVDGILDQAFSSQEKTEAPPPEIKVKSEPQVEKDPSATTWTSANPNPQPTVETSDRPQSQVQKQRSRIWVFLKRIFMVAGKIWAKRSIRYVFYLFLALILGLYIGWLLIPEPPPIIL